MFRKGKNIFNLKFFRIFAMLLFIFSLSVGIYLIIIPKSAQAAWFNDNWGYRKSIPITSTNGSDQNNVFLSFSLDTATLISASKMQSSCQDIRITDQTGNILFHHIGRTNACNNAATTVDFLPTGVLNGASNFYIYYGNSSVGSTDRGAFSQSEAANYSVGTLGSEAVESAPSAYWKFDEGYGTSTQDSTSNKNIGTINSGATWQTDDQCILGKCLRFDGVDDYISVADNTNLGSTVIKTVSLWIKPNQNVQNLQRIIGESTDSSTGWSVALNTDVNGPVGVTVGIFASGNDRFAVSPSGSISANKWYNVAFTYNGTNITGLYINGIAQNITTSSTLTANNPAGFRIGGRTNDNARNFQGFIDEIKIYSSVRSSAELSAGYNARGNNEGAALQTGNSKNQPGALSSGLIGYWKMDESSWDGTSGEVKDASGNGSNGTSQNGVTTGVGKFGSGGVFDGTDDEVDIASNSTFTSLSSLTLSVWVKATAWSGIRELVKKDQNYWLRSDNGSTGTFMVQSPIRNTVAFTLPSTGVWHHIIGTYDGVNMSVYIDGDFQASTAQTGTTGTSSDGIQIGGANAERFAGTMDEVRVYNKSLSGNEVSQLYNFAAGPVGYWKFDEKTGSSVSDISGNENNGSWNGSGSSHWTTGKYGSGGYFNGVDDYIQASAPNITGPHTMSIWVNPSSFSDYNTVFDSQTTADDANSQYNIYLKGNSEAATYMNGECTSGAALTAGVWSHLAFTYNGTDTKIYQNGSLVKTCALVKPSVTTTLVRFGARTSSNNPFAGKLDEAKLYNYERSQKQILEDMNGGHPSITAASAGTSPIGPRGGPIGYWKFDEGYGTAANNSGAAGNVLNGLLHHSSPATSTSGWTQAGKFGKALNFDGIDDYVSTSLTVPDSGTISLWAYPTDTSTDKASAAGWRYSSYLGGYIVIDIGDGSLKKWRALFDPDGFGVGVAETSVSGTNVALNAWQHVVMTWALDSGGTRTITLYVNGIKQGTTTWTGTYNDLFGTFRIGHAGSDGVYHFTGGVDEVKVYNYALATDEVKLEYNHGSALVLGGVSDKSTYQPQAANQEYCVPGDSTSCAAPVGRWDFEEKSGQTTSDSSGNENNGTFGASASSGSDDPTWANGQTGAGLTFASGDYVDIAHSSSLNVGGTSSSYTVEAWINTTQSYTDSDPHTIIGKATSLSSAYPFTLNYDDGGSIIFTIRDSTTAVSASGSLPRSTNGKWHHLVGVRNVSTDKLYMYIDGILLSSTTDTTTGSTVNAVNVTIGHLGTNAYNYNGRIDNVRIYNYARTAPQIAWEYNRGAPVAWYKLDECQGTIAHDSSGNGIDGTISKGSSGTTSIGTCTTSSSMWAGVSGDGEGKINSALTFDGTDDSVLVADKTPIKNLFDNGGSIAFWVNTVDDGSSGIGRVFDKTATTAHRGWFLYIAGSALWFNQGFTTTDGQWLTNRNSDFVYSFNTWIHVVLTYDNSSVNNTPTIYVNGIQVPVPSDFFSSNPSGTRADDSGADLYIGNRSTLNRALNGRLDDVRLYRYQLTAGQVKLLYNQNAAAKFAPVTGTP